MCIEPVIRTRRGHTLIEMVVAVAVFSISGLALASVYFFAMKSFASMGNYAVLDKANRQAMDLLTREIRQAKQVTAYSTNSITIVNGDDLTVTYLFRGPSKQMVRTASDGSYRVLLDNCDLLNFQLYQRNPVGGTYDAYPVATANWQQTVKVVQLSWKTSRTMLQGQVTSENVQTARVVIRKQKSI
jgi:prepilin-type N-terminal cleavage/methylation domain-containing protein